ncbi:MAG: 2-oxoacid:ferredoxin oxidoreductase subunit beta [Planctomycetota bacterium]|jgi:2-oxoglutarate ferredoxin oxidoreductase subunit beta
MTHTELPTYKPRDFATDQEVRWCPGCGDYAILNAVRKALPSMARRREDYVFVSGIGCAARFPYYMNTYGMHSIHGRAPAFATGVKLANPGLDVWLVSGDGDLLSIGGNHTIHLMRRNVDVNVLLFNNRIYGLTKGQYSPTSEFGKRTKSTPLGSLDYPVNPLSLAIGAGCTFVARGIDVEVKDLENLMLDAARHHGTSLIEIYQDCNIFNHQAFFYASQKDSKGDATVRLEHGKPLVFGAERDKGIRIHDRHDARLEVVQLGNGVTEDDLLIHDETDAGMAFLLSHMEHPEFPEALGVLYRNSDRRPYDALVHEQVMAATESHGDGDLEALLAEGDTWTIDE